MRLTLCVAAVVVAAASVNAAVSKAQADRLHAAAIVLQEIHQAPDKDVPEDLWEKASCVAVFPSVKKAAFIVGGEYGKGIMSCRNGAAWSAPAFMELEKGSVGFQIGGESVDLVLLVMNDQGVNRLLQDKVTLGGEISLAAGPVGRDARAMTDAQLKAEMLSYSRSQGLFAGINLSGGVVKPDQDANVALYGAKTSRRDILLDKKVAAPGEASEFMRSLERHAPAAKSE